MTPRRSVVDHPGTPALSLVEAIAWLQRAGDRIETLREGALFRVNRTLRLTAEDVVKRQQVCATMAARAGRGRQ